MLRVISLILAVGVVSSSPISKHGPQPVQENCICLNQTKIEENGGFRGEYSYVDPVGSKITVSYTYNREGSYNEKRRVDKNYGGMQTVIRPINQGTSSSVQAKSEQSQIVLRKVIPLLGSTISSTVRQIVQVNSGLGVDSLLGKVSLSLRPMVSRHVVKVVKQEGFSNLDTEEITSRIIEQLAPTLGEQIRQVQTTQTTTTITASTNTEPELGPDDLIAKIVAKLQPIITQTVEETYGSRTTHFKTTGQAHQTQPVVSQVTTTIDRSHSNINPDKLVSNIVGKVTPIITETVEIHEEQIKETGTLELSTEVVETIVAQLQPSIQATLTTVVTQATSSSSNDDLADLIMQQLRMQITEAIQSGTQGLSTDKRFKFELEIRKQLRQVVLATISAYRATIEDQSFAKVDQLMHSEMKITESEFSTDLVTTLVSNMQPYILQVVTTALSSETTTTLSNDALVNLIIKKLDSKIDDAIADSDTGFTLEKNRRLHSQIVLSLKPVIQAAIGPIRSNQDQRQTIEIETMIFAPEFTQEVIKESKNAIESVVEETFGKGKIDIDVTDSYDTVLDDLKPRVETTIKTAIQRRPIRIPSNFYQSETYFKALEAIITQVRVLVTSLVSEMRESETILVRQVVEELKANHLPVVVTKVLQNIGKQDKTSVISKVNTEVSSLVQARLPSDAREFQIQRWTRLILQELQLVIKTEIETQSQALLLRQSQSTDEEIVDQAVISVQSQLTQIIKSAFESNPSNSGDAIYLKVVQEIRSASSKFLPTSSSQSQIDEWIRLIILRLESTIRTEIRTFTTSRKAILRTEIIEILFNDFKTKLEGLISGFFASFSKENVPSETVAIADVQGEVRSQIQNTLGQLILSAKYSILGTSESQIVDEVMDKLRAVIERTVRIQIKRFQTTKTSVVKAQTQSSKITSIFGTSGLNTVQLGIS
ncbi:uncharacterized protein LOC131888010 isoform X2 [Tigriopus californicus]|uniref:uncharacterized protein LOC131888010 isoform X2 n=1 Tax=Tigriopus californicus TaxID=6832 RepID=UPI0027DAA148|nr:uncharacterized protein LOC131888010 isoform X2 [Tigriopus californicus]